MVFNLRLNFTKLFEFNFYEFAGVNYEIYSSTRSRNNKFPGYNF